MAYIFLNVFSYLLSIAQALSTWHRFPPLSPDRLRTSCHHPRRRGGGGRSEGAGDHRHCFGSHIFRERISDGPVHSARTLTRYVSSEVHLYR